MGPLYFVMISNPLIQDLSGYKPREKLCLTCFAWGTESSLGLRRRIVSLDRRKPARVGHAKGLECWLRTLPNKVKNTGDFTDKVCYMISLIKLQL
jgi:hypothetical protein